LVDPLPLVVEAVNHLKVRSCLNDGEVVCCDERGLARFDVRRQRKPRREAGACELHGLATVSCQLDANQSSLRAVARRDINKTRLRVQAPIGGMRLKCKPRRLPAGDLELSHD
jgi:hypothetical protein